MPKPYSISSGASLGKECLLCGRGIERGRMVVKLSMTITVLFGMTVKKNEEVEIECARLFSKEISRITGGRP